MAYRDDPDMIVKFSVGQLATLFDSISEYLGLFCVQVLKLVFYRIFLYGYRIHVKFKAQHFLLISATTQSTMKVNLLVRLGHVSDQSIVHWVISDLVSTGI